MRAIPKAEIQWVVARFHVGTDNEQIARDIRRRLRGNPWIATAAGQRFEDRCVAFALKCHADNQDLYRAVTGGTLGHVSGRKTRVSRARAKEPTRSAAPESERVPLPSKEEIQAGLEHFRALQARKGLLF